MPPRHPTKFSASLRYFAGTPLSELSGIRLLGRQSFE